MIEKAEKVYSERQALPDWLSLLVDGLLVSNFFTHLYITMIF